MKSRARTGFYASIFSFVSALLLGHTADADPTYQFVGKIDSPLEYDNPSRIASWAGVVGPRIDNSGHISNPRLEHHLDAPAMYNAIQAPYVVGEAGTFPTDGGSRYQVGEITTTSPVSPWQAMNWDDQTQSGQALGPVPDSKAWPWLESIDS